ncbi:MAG: hypothetical protein QE284_12925 [Rhizobium sp.]|nr:hypothetical protein [Rhizobium sp.]
MVERISRISRSEASSRTEAGHTLNLGSDSENAWIAARQSKINDDIEERRRLFSEERSLDGILEDDEATPDTAFPSRQWVEPSEPEEQPEDGAEEPRLSGESERIGTQNFDEDTPFGDRVVIV